MLRFVQSGEVIDQEEAERIADEHAIPSLLAHALLQRGLCEREEIEAFLNPGPQYLYDPFLMPGMQTAVAAIQEALLQKAHMCVYGDYDADGICATAMLTRYLKSRGAAVTTHVPDRHSEGYGMQMEAIDRLYETGVTLIITVDNGIAAADEIAYCYERGIKVIVTDHHQCPDALPACEAVLNPHMHMPGAGAYPFADLCGAGVVLKLIQALEEGAPQGHTLEGPALQDSQYMALAAVATIADIVPLLGENRVIAVLGMRLMEEQPGLCALLTVVGAMGEITSDVIAFRVAPRLNAAGRMGDAGRALLLLLTDDAQQATALALELNEENAMRQTEEQTILDDAQNRLKHENTAQLRAIMLYSPHWNKGIIGIVASRLCKQYHRPVLLFTQEGDMLTGSCRSIEGVHLYDCLRAHESYFIKFGGHAQAAGVSMRVEAFAAFNAAFQAYLRVHTLQTLYLPLARFEREVALSAITIKEIELLGKLAPFGAGNPQPVYFSRAVTLADIERMGKGRAHLRAIAQAGQKQFEVVGFGYGHYAMDLARGDRFHILYTPAINEWQGLRHIQLQLQAIKHEDIFNGEELLCKRQMKFYNAIFHNVLYNVTQAAKRTIIEIDAFVTETLRTCIHGTLMLCMTPDGAARLRRLLLAAGLHESVQVYFEKLPQSAQSYNTVLLAPLLQGLQTDGFDRVVIYDAAQTLPLWPNAGCETITAFTPDVYAMLSPLKRTREEMGALYRRFRTALREEPFSRSELVKKTMPDEERLATLALAVFVELGFFAWNGEKDKLCINENAAMRPLSESRLYLAVNGEKGV